MRIWCWRHQSAQLGIGRGGHACEHTTPCRTCVNYRVYLFGVECDVSLVDVLA